MQAATKKDIADYEESEYGPYLRYLLDLYDKWTDHNERFFKHMKKPLLAQRRQWVFLALDLLEGMFGGALGGGKSYGLILDSAKETYNGNYRAIFFRRHIEDLRTLIENAKIVYTQVDPKVRFNETLRIFRFSSGATILFTYYKDFFSSPGSAGNSKNTQFGQEYTAVFWDELNQFLEHEYIFMFTRIRSTDATLHRRVRSSTNPGNIGHSWIKRRYLIDKVAPGTIIQDPDTGGRRIFVPSFLADNQILLKNDPTYTSRVKMLSKEDQKALLRGSWDIAAGDYFTNFSPSRHILTWDKFNEIYSLPTWNRKIPKHWPRVMGFDYGTGKPWAAVWIAFDPQGRYILYRERYGCDDPVNKPNVGNNMSVAQICKVIKVAEAGEDIRIRVGDPAIHKDKNEDAIPFSEIFERQGIYFQRADNHRVQGWRSMFELFDMKGVIRNADGSLLSRPSMYIMDECVNWIRTVPILPRHPKRTDDIYTEAEDHLADATRYVVHTVRPIEHGSNEVDDITASFWSA